MLHLKPAIRQHRLHRLLPLIGILSLSFAAGCGHNKMTSPSGDVPLTLIAMAAAPTGATALHHDAPDTLPVTFSNVLLVVRDVRFKLADTPDTLGDDDDHGFLAALHGGGHGNDGDDDDGDGHGHGEDDHHDGENDAPSVVFQGPFVVDLLTQSADSLDTQMVPPGEYRSTKGSIGPLEASDWNAADFEFLVGSTVYLQGTVQGDGGGDFTYQAPITHTFKINGKFVVEADTPATAFLTFDTSNWLRGKHGEFLDPRDPANDLAIRQAIIRSIRAGMDNNHDGKCNDGTHGEGD